MPSLASFLQPAGHRRPDGEIVHRRAVPAQVPDDRVVLVPASQKLSEGECVGLGEDLLVIPDLAHVLADAGDDAHRQAELVRAVHDVVNVPEESLVGPGRVAVEERIIPVEVRRLQPAQAIRLDRRETARDAVLEIDVHLFVVQPLEQRPCGVGQVIERPVLRGHQVPAVRRHLESQALHGTRRRKQRLAQPDERHGHKRLLPDPTGISRMAPPHSGQPSHAVV